MENKVCPKCNISKELKEFNKSLNSKDKLSSWCKICVRERSKKSYNTNKKQILNKQEKIRTERKIWINKIKSKLKCEKCGINHIAVLDFHHKDPKEKDFGIAKVLNWKSKENILKEIKKCMILCSNCHRILHWSIKNINSGVV